MTSRTTAALVLWLCGLGTPAHAQTIGYQEKVDTIVFDSAHGSWRSVKFVPTFQANAKSLVLRDVSVLCNFVNADPTLLPNVFFDLRFSPGTVRVRIPFAQTFVLKRNSGHFKYMIGNSPLFDVMARSSEVELTFLGDP